MEGEWRIQFRRSFGHSEILQWEHLLQILSKFTITDTPDQVRWAMEKSGLYTTRSMYRMLSHRGVENKRMKLLWGSKLPLKIKIFMWLALQDRLQSGVALKKRNWKGDSNCVVCKVPESADHIFFLCPLARFTWTCAKEALGWVRVPMSMIDFLEGWLPLGCKNYEQKMLIFAGVLWALWNFRNKMVIKGVFVKNPTDAIFKTDSLFP